MPMGLDILHNLHSVTTLLQQLQLESLAERRRVQRLV